MHGYFPRAMTLDWVSNCFLIATDVSYQTHSYWLDISTTHPSHSPKEKRGSFLTLTLSFSVTLKYDLNPQLGLKNWFLAWSSVQHCLNRTLLCGIISQPWWPPSALPAAERTRSRIKLGYPSQSLLNRSTAQGEKHRAGQHSLWVQVGGMTTHLDPGSRGILSCLTLGLSSNMW